VDTKIKRFIAGKSSKADMQAAMAPMNADIISRLFETNILENIAAK
jgi:hypothetical protein